MTDEDVNKMVVDASMDNLIRSASRYVTELIGHVQALQVMMDDEHKREHYRQLAEVELGNMRKEMGILNLTCEDMDDTVFYSEAVSGEDGLLDRLVEISSDCDILEGSL